MPIRRRSLSNSVDNPLDLSLDSSSMSSKKNGVYIPLPQSNPDHQRSQRLPRTRYSIGEPSSNGSVTGGAGFNGNGGPGGNGSSGMWGRLLSSKRNILILVGLATILLLAGRKSTDVYPSSKKHVANKDNTDSQGITHPPANQAGVSLSVEELSAFPTSASNPIPGDNASSQPTTPTTEQKCVPPPSPHPQHRYALMIDAGSTGSRIHVYKFLYCLPPATASSKDPYLSLESEGFHSLQPGLSSYASSPSLAALSLTPLLEAALEEVPKDEHKCTPIAVKATAGLRLLGEKESQKILDQVEGWLKKEWPFPLANKGRPVEIMEGKDEGVYAWITINYLLGLIGPSAPADAVTAAVMDLGGASTQIVFEPSSIGDSDVLEFDPSIGSHIYKLTFANRVHTLYQHSHLGYGLMQARRATHNLVAFSHIWSSVPRGKAIEWHELDENVQIPNSCLFKDQTKKVALDPPGRDAKNVTMMGTGTMGSFDACRRMVDVVMAKDALCEVEPCAFGGVWQPHLGETFKGGMIYALSYFYDRIYPLIQALYSSDDESPTLSISTLRSLTSTVCNGPPFDAFSHSKEAMDELTDRPEYCLDLSFMYSLLSLGYELDSDREVRVGKKLGGIELGWALGAALAMLDGEIDCLV